MNVRSIALALALALAGASATAAPAPAQTLPVLRIAVLPTDSVSEAFDALELGIFKRNGLDVQLTMLSNGPAVAAAVAGGAADIGASSLVNLAIAHQHGVPIGLIAPAGIYSSQAATIGLVVLKSSPIRTAKDLNGKIVGVDSLKSLATTTTSAWADRNGGDAKTLKFAEMGFGPMGAALETGRVDAAYIAEPTLDTVLAGSGRLLAKPLDAVASKFVLGAWFSTLDFANQHPDIIHRFVQAMIETADWANKNPHAAGTILAKYTQTPVNDAIPRLPQAGTFDPAMVQPLLDACVKYGVLDRPIAASELYVPEIMPKAS
jgi:NitT/TauT family transport system substrate-binding protein